ncbi:Uncharacterized protein SCF082_LOCUS15618 [Durusdinium trenchii]|uniref:Uncharacterized protein n=1 Tax=Durusdinium trenchii TaxID=1381693 RepID=A0ABP0K702_9DINO
MQNPHLKDVLVNFPDVVPDSLPWPKDADAWSLKDLEIFIGSGGFLKPKKKAAAPSAPPAPPRTTGASSPEQAVSGYAEANGTALPAADAAPAVPAPFGFETPGFNQEKHRFIMPVRVHCEDTAPNGHVRVESLVAYAERIRSLALKQIMASWWQGSGGDDMDLGQHSGDPLVISGG